jgi:hypothetical protein
MDTLTEIDYKIVRWLKSMQSMIVVEFETIHSHNSIDSSRNSTLFPPVVACNLFLQLFYQKYCLKMI